MLDTDRLRTWLARQRESTSKRSCRLDARTRSALTTERDWSGIALDLPASLHKFCFEFKGLDFSSASGLSLYAKFEAFQHPDRLHRLGLLGQASSAALHHEPCFIGPLKRSRSRREGQQGQRLCGSFLDRRHRSRQAWWAAHMQCRKLALVDVLQWQHALHDWPASLHAMPRAGSALRCPRAASAAQTSCQRHLSEASTGWRRAAACPQSAALAYTQAPPEQRVPCTHTVHLKQSSTERPDRIAVLSGRECFSAAIQSPSHLAAHSRGRRSSACAFARNVALHKRNAPNSRQAQYHPHSGRLHAVAQPHSREQLRPAEQPAGRKPFSSSAQAASVASSAASNGGAQILDGQATSAQWLQELKAPMRDVSAALQRRPGLSVIVVGSRADSSVYVGKKEEACRQVRNLSRSVMFEMRTGRQRVRLAQATLVRDGAVRSARRECWKRRAALLMCARPHSCDGVFVALQAAERPCIKLAGAASKASQPQVIMLPILVASTFDRQPRCLSAYEFQDQPTR